MECNKGSRTLDEFQIKLPDLGRVQLFSLFKSLKLSTLPKTCLFTENVTCWQVGEVLIEGWEVWSDNISSDRIWQCHLEFMVLLSWLYCISFKYNICWGSEVHFFVGHGVVGLSPQCKLFYDDILECHSLCGLCEMSSEKVCTEGQHYYHL